MAKSEVRFEGFPKGTLAFLKGLQKNNTKEWFDAHRKDYEEQVDGPSKAFVVAMGERLAEIAPKIQAVPKVNGSLFRINRDTRFSADKSPYKTSIGVFFWEGSRPKMECPGFYLHLEPRAMMLGAGIYMFTKDALEVYRKAVVDPKLGPALRKAVDAVGPETVGQAGCGMPLDRYKKVPKGYDPAHPNADLLLLKGLHAGCEEPVPAALHTAELVDYALDRWRRLAPIHKWLVKALGVG